MAAPFNSSNYAAKGTLIPNGIRTGIPMQPPTALAADNFLAQPYSVLGNNYQLNGGGITMSPIFTYRFRPYGGKLGNIVNLTTVAQAGWMTLSGDGYASTLLTPNASVPYSSINKANTPENPTDADVFVLNAGYTTAPSPIFPDGAPNSTFLQFDYPRVPAIGLWDTSTNKWGGSMVGTVEITIFGYDIYSQPMQHTYSVGSVTEDVEAGPNQFPGYLYGTVQQAKAFYGITGVYVNGLTGANTQLQIYTCNQFGLPFALQSTKDIIEFSVSRVPQYTTDMKNFSMYIGMDAATTPLSVICPFGQYNEKLTSTLAATGTSAPQLSPTTFSDNADIAKSVYISASNFANEASVGQAPRLTFSPTAALTGIMNFTVNYPNSHAYLTKTMPFINIFDLAPSTSTSSDTRGLIMLPDWSYESNPTTGDLGLEQYDWGIEVTPQVSGNVEVIFTYYVKGADSTVNVLAMGAQPQGVLSSPPAPSEEIPAQVQPLKFEDLYGNLPYYTGTIS